MEAYLSNLTVFNHPLIKHKVSHLCDVNTGTKEFSELVKELAMLMGYETLKELKTKDVGDPQAPAAEDHYPGACRGFHHRSDSARRPRHGRRPA